MVTSLLPSLLPSVPFLTASQMCRAEPTHADSVLDPESTALTWRSSRPGSGTAGEPQVGQAAREKRFDCGTQFPGAPDGGARCPATPCAGARWGLRAVHHEAAHAWGCACSVRSSDRP